MRFFLRWVYRNILSSGFLSFILIVGLAYIAVWVLPNTYTNYLDADNTLKQANDRLSSLKTKQSKLDDRVSGGEVLAGGLSDVESMIYRLNQAKPGMIRLSMHVSNEKRSVPYFGRKITLPFRVVNAEITVEKTDDIDLLNRIFNFTKRRLKFVEYIGRPGNHQFRFERLRPGG